MIRRILTGMSVAALLLSATAALAGPPTRDKTVGDESLRPQVLASQVVLVGDGALRGMPDSQRLRM